MQRATASLLIALVALMALLPQAMCPCSTRARAEATAATCSAVPTIDCPMRVKAPCCPLCRARALQRNTQASASDPCKSPEAPRPCSCCQLNGQGKTLVLRGDVVKPLAPAAVEFAALPAPALLFGTLAETIVARPVVPDALASPPAELREGVVLLI